MYLSIFHAILWWTKSNKAEINKTFSTKSHGHFYLFSDATGIGCFTWRTWSVFVLLMLLFTCLFSEIYIYTYIIHVCQSNVTTVELQNMDLGIDMVHVLFIWMQKMTFIIIYMKMIDKWDKWMNKTAEWITEKIEVENERGRKNVLQFVNLLTLHSNHIC